MNSRPCKSKRGAALVTVLLMTGIASAIMASYLSYSSQAARATMRMIDYQKAQIAAEAALEYGVMQLRETVLDHQLSLPQASIQVLLDQIQPPSRVGAYHFTTPGGSVAFEVEANTAPISGVITNGAACIGSEGEYEVFTVKAGALNPGTGVGAVLEQQVQGVGLFLIRYAVFYEEDLEMNPGAPMTITGPVHVNADIYAAPDGSSLRCNDRVTAVGDLFRRRKDSVRNIGYVGVDDTSSIEVPMTIDSDSPDWMAEALRLWGGRVLSKAHGVQHLSPPIATVDEPHDLVERPLDPADPLYQAQTEAEKFANKACVTIHVYSNASYSIVDCHSNDVTHLFTNAVLLTNGAYNGKPTYAKTATGQYRFQTNGALRADTAGFMDRRENATMVPVDIYVDRFTNCFPQAVGTNYTIRDGRGVVYVTRDDPDGPTNGVQPCVRIRNGGSLPAGGLSFASDLPIYVEGHYNVTNTQPALLAGDAVTFLSTVWQDAKSWSTLGARAADSTTYNVVIMTGNSETQWGGYNGGLENALRFLENWTGKTVKFRGSVIDLWYAEIARGAWTYGQYYTAPNRDWGYDTMYRSKVPPGMTRVFGVEEIQWIESTWAQAGW